MANPKTKGPSRSVIKNMESTAETIKKHSGALKKLSPHFDKLNFKQKGAVAVLKNLQGYYPEDEQYSDKSIRNRILSELGVASGKFDDFKTVGRDSAGREQTRKEQKKKNPAGFAHGGMVHRGRKASGSSEKG